MKNILFLMALSLIACKKEEPVPPTKMCECVRIINTDTTSPFANVILTDHWVGLDSQDTAMVCGLGSSFNYSVNYPGNPPKNFMGTYSGGDLIIP